MRQRERDDVVAAGRAERAVSAGADHEVLPLVSAGAIRHRSGLPARGQVLYANMCSTCHGLALNGGESAPPLSGGEFLSNWNGLTVGDLFDRIRTSMPADSPGRLKRERVADILAEILAVNQFPAGSIELAHQSEVLKEIRFEAARPERK